MNFNSLAFVAFAIVVFLLYYTPQLKPYQVGILIVASVVFYAYGQPYLLILLLFSATANAICSFGVLRARGTRTALLWAIAGVLLNIVVLAFFKYNRLLAQAISADLSAVDGPGSLLLVLPLPIGISFYTFHGISLVVDVFKRGDLRGGNAGDKPVLSLPSHLYRTLLYLTFFPQLIAGPIVKAHFFYPQIVPKRLAEIDWELAIKALLTGYFLKLVIADNLHDQTFWIQYPYFLNFSSANLVVFLFGYSMQIFADFAGYSLIAIGLAALFGYRLPQNFNFPYLSQTFSEFWTRWHMSLSAFLREYLYYPLGGNRKGPVRTYVNLMLVMTLGGLWHGAALSYAVWGAWHGMALVIERRFRDSWFYRTDNKLLRKLRIGVVFLFVSFAWLLFKLPNFTEVVEYVAAIGANFSKTPNLLFMLVIAVYATPVIAYHILHRLQSKHPHALRAIRPALYGAMLAAILLNSGRPNAFIYFQF